ncbi:uncharacterized protein ACIQIH_009910 isoform 1-T1 [Cyanocitta cristata]
MSELVLLLIEHPGSGSLSAKSLPRVCGVLAALQTCHYHRQVVPLQGYVLVSLVISEVKTTICIPMLMKICWAKYKIDSKFGIWHRVVNWNKKLAWNHKTPLLV